MSLVAYDTNSESEEEINNESSGRILISNSTSEESQETITTATTKDNTLIRLFAALPTPISSQENIVIKRKKQDGYCLKYPFVLAFPFPNPPAIDSDSDEEEEPELKKPRKNAGSLLDLLPPPKSVPLSTTSFVPHVLQKKPTNNGKKIKQLSQQIIKQTGYKIEPELKDSDVDSDDDSEIPETYDDKMWEKICGKQKADPLPAPGHRGTEFKEPEYTTPVEIAPDVSEPYKGLDNRAFKDLMKSGKKAKENIKFIDIHEDEIRLDQGEWLKSLTDPNAEPNEDDADSVNNTCKAKNHITALAQKALANDKELQTRWAESRFNRKQTQAKYGF